MVSEKFRRQLRQEAEVWWQQGVIDATQYEQLALRYQFQALERDAKSRFVFILMGLGGILLGLGVITYVAANWQGWPRAMRVVLLLSLLIGVNTAGFYLWRRPPTQSGRTLGHGLLLLGALVLGANLALMSQMFHQSGNLYELFLVWGLGVLAMAYGLELVSLGLLALLLLTLGYQLGTLDWGGSMPSGWRLVLQQMPLVLAGLWLPLAYRCRSRWLFGLTAAAVTLTLMGNLLVLAGDYRNGWPLALAVGLPPALLWAYGDTLWQWRRQPQLATAPSRFQSLSRALGVTYLAGATYILAFHGFWQDYGYLWRRSQPQSWPMLVSVVLLSVMAALGWVAIIRQGWHQRQWPSWALHSGTVAGVIVVAAGTVLWHRQLMPLPLGAPLIYNLLLFGLALGLLRDGLALGSRGWFWSGMGLLVVGILSRTLEYNTDLLLKALAFALCGVAMIGAGIWFERQVRPTVSS